MKTLLFHLHNEVVLSLPFVVAVEILSSLQLIHLIFQSMTYTFIEDQVLLRGFFQALAYFTGAFDMNRYSNSEKLVCIVWGIFMAYLALHLFLFTAVWSLKFIAKRKDKQIIQFLGILYVLHARVFFFPINFFFMNIIILWRNRNGLTGESFYLKDTILILTVFGLIFNSCLSTIKEFLLYQTNLSRCAYGAKTNIYSQIVIVNKLLGILLYFFTQNGSQAAIDSSSIIYLLFSLLLLSVLYIELPFYKLQVLRVSVIMNSFILSVAILSIIQTFVTNKEVLGSIQIFIFLFPLMVIKGFLIQFRALFNRILKGKFQSPGHGIQFALLFGEFSNGNIKFHGRGKSFLPDYHKFIGVLSDREIGLQKSQGIENVKEIEILLFQYIIEKLKVASELYPKSQTLSIFMAQIYMEKLGNIPKALELIRKLENRSLSFSMRKTIQYVYLELEANYARETVESERRLQLSNYVKYSELTGLIKTNILREIDNHTEFWEDVNKGSLDLKKVADKIEEIDILAVRIKKQYENNLEQFSQNFSLPILVYAVYLSFVRDSHAQSLEFLKKFQSLSIHQLGKNEFDIYSETVAAILVSLDKAKTGEILAVTGSIQNLYDINKEDLIGQKFSLLFPNIIAKNHHTFLQQHAKSLEHKVDLKQKTYGKCANGGFFELEVHFQLYPYFNREITMMILMEKITDSEPILFVDQFGNIVCCSKPLEEKFRKESFSITSLKMMQDIMADFSTINKAFNMIYLDQLQHNHSNAPLENDKQVCLTDSKNPQESLALESKRTVEFSYPDEDNYLLNSLTKRSQYDKDFQKDIKNHQSGLLKPLSTETNENIIKHQNPELTVENAQEICQKYIRGKRVVLCSNNNNTPMVKKRNTLQADIRIKPYILGGNLYKALTFQKITRDFQSNSPIDKRSPWIERSFSDFADEFPVTEEQKQIKDSLQKEQTIDNLPIRFIKGEEEVLDEAIERDSKVIKKERKNNLNQKENLRDIIIKQFENDDQKSSLINSDNKETRAMKVIRQMSSRRETSRFMKILRILLFVVTLAMIILSGVDLSLTRNSIYNIEKSIEVVNTATIRLQNAITAWQWSLLILTGTIGNPRELVDAVYNATLKLIENNHKLEQNLIGFNDKHLLDKIFEKDILLWTSPLNATYNFTITNNLAATDMIASKYLAMVSLLRSGALNTARKLETLVHVNNTANDYLTSSEEFIDDIGIGLESLISKDIKTLKITLTIQMVLLFVFSVLLILIAVFIVMSYQRLFKAVIRTPNNLVLARLTELNKAKKLFKQDVESRTFINEAFGIFEEANIKGKVKNQKEQYKAKNVNQRNYSLKNLNKYLAKLVCLGILCVPFFVVIFSLWLTKSISNFESFKETNHQIYILSEGCYQNSLVLGSLIATIGSFVIPGTTISNQPPLKKLLQNFEQLKTLNVKLSHSLLLGSKVDPVVFDILASNVCNYVPEDVGISHLKRNCLLISKDSKFGLLNLNSFYYDLSNDLLRQLGTNSNLMQAVMAFAARQDEFLGSVQTIEIVYPLLTTYIFEHFQEEIKTTSRSDLAFFSVICGGFVFFAIFIYLVPAKRFGVIDSQRRRLFKIIPYSMIQENKALKFYLIQNYPKEIESIKNVL